MSKRYPGGILRKTPQTPTQTSAQGIWDMASVTQAVKENTWPIAGVPDPISKSLRFRSSASAYLNRTPASAGNRRTWTWSAWVKRGDLTDFNMLFGATSSTSDAIGFRSSGTGLYPSSIYFYLDDLTGGGVYTNAVFRDPSAWYHIVLAVDTTQATSSNRIKLYINGTQQTFVSATYPTQNYDCRINNNVLHNIGAVNGATFLSGYLAEVNFIDGQALTPSSFGSTNDQTGVWQPIAYTGTYGTNGFYLPFSNTASTATLGYDFSGNSNNWTTNNISLTSGSTYDSMVDVPTQWIPYNTAGDTGALFRGNYAVLNPLWKGANITPTDGNLTNPLSSGSPNAALSTMPMSTGKWYAEMTNTASYGDVGLCIVAANLTAPTFTIGSTTQTGLWEVYDNGGGIYVTSDGGAFSSSLGSTRFRPAGTIQFAYDASNGYFWIGRNNTWYDSSFGTTGNPSTGANPTFTISSSRGPFNIGAGSNSATNAQYWNFGQQPFSYTPPSGFKTLCTTNLTTPTIGATASTTANKYFDATTYTGTGSTQNITNSGSMQPDWVWIKNRSSTNSHQLTDSVRGVNLALASDLTIAEFTGNINAFNTNGFQLTGATNAVNASGQTYVGWQWRASNATAVTNTAGSITSTVSANTTAGFSIVTYTGTGANATVGHGLGVAPSWVIVKRRDAVSDWCVYSSSIGAGNRLLLSQTNASAADATMWNSTAPTSTVFSIGTNVGVNSANTFVAYCFAPIAGYSAFGSYTGNGSSDGVFVYLGFRARYIMIKSTSTGGWVLLDTARDPYNDVDNYLYAQSSAAEAGSSNVLDINSNGFKIRNSWTDINGSATTYIYMAFAESPFKYSLAR